MWRRCALGRRCWCSDLWCNTTNLAPQNKHMPIHHHFRLFKIGSLFVLLLSAHSASSQPWVDTLYTYTQSTVTYGTAIDFAGNQRQLQLDICVPNNDVPPPCGRPLLIAIHGGALMAGTKNEPTPQQWMKDFAKRGYVTASLQYRLGFFQPHNEVHCNVTNLLNIPWDCLNAADTSEWSRAVYRSMQDAKGAIRYLLLYDAQYGADPNNVFICGESAGGLVALATAFMDTPADKPADAYALPDVLAPHNSYNGYCVQPLGLDTSIASMRLTRPDLGSIEGDLNLAAPAFKIKAVGNFYGAVAPNFMENNTAAMPEGIYMYHQPNDLVVPFGTQKLFAGLSNCLTGLGCAQIVNRPIMCGSGGIKQKIDQYESLGFAMPDYWLDATNNQTDCLGQIVNPGLSGHSIDNYALRTLHMAQYFASFVQCTSSTTAPESATTLRIFPNPTAGVFTIGGIEANAEWLQVYDVFGKILLSHSVEDQTGAIQVDLPDTAPDGVYICVVRTNAGAAQAGVIQYQK
jgi:acetyl esterase/lipase